MELKTYFAQDAAGNIISSAIVHVFLQGTTTLATGLTRADGTPLENPFAADGAGRIQFRAPDGYYDVQVSAGPGIIQTLTIQCVDYSEAKADADRAEAAADRSDVSAEQAQNALNSITGINTTFEQNSREQWRRSLAEAGLTLVSGSFEEGATANSSTDAVWHISGGQCYTWDGAFPKAVPADSTPASTGGIGLGAWVSVGDASLRSELYSSSGASLIGYNQKTSAVRRVLIDKLNEFVSVADFISDSDEDDTTGIQSALNVGGKVYLPDGVFNVSAPLVLNSNTFFYGPGKINSTNQTDSVIKIVNSLNVTIEGISVSRSLSSNPGSSSLSSDILVDNSQRVRINLAKTEISRIGNCILVTNGSRDVNVAGCYCTTDGSFDASELQTAGTVASPNGIFIADSCRDILVYGNACENIGHGVMIQNVSGTTPIYNVIVSNNNIRKCSSYGVLSYRLSGSIYNVNISDNIIEDVYGTYYNASTPSTPYTHGSGIYGQNVHRHVIKGNLIRNVCVNTNNFGTLSPAGIGFGSVTGFDISDNIISLSGSNGIIIDGSDSIVSRNTIKETTRAAIRSRVSTRLTINANSIDCSLSGTQGVLLEDSTAIGAHKYAKVIDNTIFGSSSPISGSGLQNSLVAGNIIDSSSASSGTGIGISGASSYDTDILNNKVTVSSGYGIRCIASGRVIGNQVKGATSGQSIIQYHSVFFKDNKSDTGGSGSVFVAQEITSANLITPLWLSDNIMINITGTTQINGVYNVPIGATVTIRVPSGITLGNVVGSDGIRFRFSDGAAKTTTKTQVFQFVHLLNGILDCVSIQ